MIKLLIEKDVTYNLILISVPVSLNNPKIIYSIGCQDKKKKNPINHHQSEIYIINANWGEGHTGYV